MLLQKSAEHQTGGGKELNRVSFITQARAQGSSKQRQQHLACLPAFWQYCPLCSMSRILAAMPKPALAGCSLLLQVKARPPTFVVWISGSTSLSVPSQRFLAGQIRRQFGFGGVPLRIVVRHKPPRKQRSRK